MSKLFIENADVLGPNGVSITDAVAAAGKADGWYEQTYEDCPGRGLGRWAIQTSPRPIAYGCRAALCACPTARWQARVSVLGGR